jgi:DNA repair protein SbcD/Mre11
MRLIHTADWHLGRLFYGMHLTDDQEAVLGQLADLARDEHADAVLVAGDVYDRAVPPPEAVSLLSDILGRLVYEAGVTVVVIAGNHDSARRLEFAAGLLAEQRLHIVGRLPQIHRPIRLHDAHGPVLVHAIPYADPAEVRALLGAEIHDHAAAMAALCERARATQPTGTRSICLTHAFVAGSTESSLSERPLSVGGSSQVPLEAFRGFDYVALGHLHRPQPDDLTRTVRYSGSLLKYSFDEWQQPKSVTIVDLGPPQEGGCTVQVRTKTLTPPRDVRRLEGTLNDLLMAAAADPHPADFIEAIYTDATAVYDPMQQLRSVYPNTLATHPLRHDAPEGPASGPVDPFDLDDLDLFGDFWQQVTGDELTAEERAAVAAVLDGLERRRREAP